MKTIKEMIEVMQAYEEGKDVEFTDIDGNNIPIGPYIPYDGKLSFDWVDFDYRVKPELKKRPMTFEEIVAYWKEHRTEILTVHSKSGYVIRHGTITSVNDTSETISVCEYFYDVIEFCQFVTKEDGSRFEIDETES